MKDTVTPDTPDQGVPASNDARATSHRDPDSEPTYSLTEVDDDTTKDLSAATTEHLRRLWMAGARDITVTYDADVVRHRTYLSHPRTET